MLLSRLHRFTFVAIVCLCLLWVAKSIWQESKLTQKLMLGSLSAGSSKILGTAGTAHMRRVLFQEYKQQTVSPSLMVEVAESYLKKHPLDSNVWLWSSVFRYRGNEFDVASVELARAHRLSKNHAPMLNRIFNRYIEIRNYEQAMGVAHDISLADPRSFRKLFYLMGRLYNDYDTLVETVIPASVPVSSLNNPALAPDFYFNAAMVDAIRVQNLALAKAVWHGAPDKLKLNSRFGLRYLEFLIAQQESAAFISAWSEHSNMDLAIGSLAHQSFGSENSACWNVISFDDDRVSYDISETELGEQLQVNFTGTENINFHHVKCSLVLKPGKQYKLTGEWKGINITTLSGPFFELYAPSVQGSYRRTKPLTGSWEWQKFELVFTSHEEASTYLLRLRRTKTDYLDSKISGSLIIRGLDLSELGDSAGKDTLSRRGDLTSIDFDI